ncbi:MAG: nitrilase-related carbon-nitrogen hydrolase [Candidatus Nanopelagicales bacterium]
MTRVGLVQLAVEESEPVQERVARTLAAVTTAAAHADLVMLPELWPTGAFDLALGVEHAQSIDGPLVTELADVAVSTQTWLHGGSFVERAGDDEYFNTSVLFNPQGDLVASYRKIHLFGFDTGEAATLTAGTDVVVVDTPLGRTALATCYDLRFPELFRAQIDLGATAVLLTSGWPSQRIARWNLLAAARACENQMWVIGCNEVGRHGGQDLGGNSLIADPWGEVIAAAGQNEDTLYADIVPSLPAEVRASFPVLPDRRL